MILQAGRASASAARHVRRSRHPHASFRGGGFAAERSNFLTGQRTHGTSASRRAGLHRVMHTSNPDGAKGPKVSYRRVKALRGKSAPLGDDDKIGPKVSGKGQGVRGRAPIRPEFKFLVALASESEPNSLAVPRQQREPTTGCGRSLARDRGVSGGADGLAPVRAAGRSEVHLWKVTACLLLRPEVARQRCSRDRERDRGAGRGEWPGHKRFPSSQWLDTPPNRPTSRSAGLHRVRVLPRAAGTDG